MRRRLPCDSHEPLPIRLRISTGMTLAASSFSGGDYFDVKSLPHWARCAVSP